jgi:hypothetical protein
MMMTVVARMLWGYQKRNDVVLVPMMISMVLGMIEVHLRLRGRRLVEIGRKV